MRKRVAGERWPKSSPTKSVQPSEEATTIVVEVHVCVGRV